MKSLLITQKNRRILVEIIINQLRPIEAGMLSFCFISPREDQLIESDLYERFDASSFHICSLEIVENSKIMNKFYDSFKIKRCQISVRDSL